MIEKIMLSLLMLMAAVIGWFIKEMLGEIRGTQKEHGTSLRILRENVTSLETKQANVEYSLRKVQESVTATAQLQRESKSILDHNLYEIRQQLKEQTDKQFKQEQNFGKVILIVQKLYAAVKGNGAGT